MANITTENLGLNNIALFQLNNAHSTLKSNIERNFERVMSGLSHIPRPSFGGVKRSSRNTTPVNDVIPRGEEEDRPDVKSAPASKESSLIVGRSKSLRLPRKQYGGGGLGCSSASKLEASKRYQGIYMHVHVDVCVVCVCARVRMCVVVLILHVIIVLVWI